MYKSPWLPITLGPDSITMGSIASSGGCIVRVKFFIIEHFNNDDDDDDDDDPFGLHNDLMTGGDGISVTILLTDGLINLMMIMIMIMIIMIIMMMIIMMMMMMILTHMALSVSFYY